LIGSNILVDPYSNGRHQRPLLTFLVARAGHEVDRDGDVRHESRHPAGADVLDELVDLDRDERSGDENGQPFSPAPAHDQTDALDEKHGRVGDGQDAEVARRLVIER
jgi:hypothetical protein